ncbi:hypothetical protein AB0M50_41245 [Nonomuraea fuscirosea]|uniref:hypothetical protein n=1 Tax=Nonomuraea fuscirosea TaxID=1291556 RepID=UPI0034330BB1
MNAAALLGAGLILRAVLVPFFHPLMVALLGLGVAAAADRPGGAARTGLVLRRRERRAARARMTGAAVVERPEP